MLLPNLITVVTGAEASTSVMDLGIVQEFIALIKEFLGLFNIFPLNVFMIAAFCGIGITIFTKLRRAVGK